MNAMAPISLAHPDADLLALCARLAEMQAEWQRLWEPTSEDWGLDAPPVTEADHIWLRYNDHVWPGIHISGQTPRHPDDLPAQLLDYRPVTPEGVRAKAAAVLAMEDAACYGADCAGRRLRDVSTRSSSMPLGPARCLMGEDAERAAGGFPKVVERG